MSNLSKSLASTASVPLCVDLEGILPTADLLVQSTLAGLKLRPWRILVIPFWLIRGRASLKRRMHENLVLSPSRLPYNQQVIHWIESEKSAGRTVILVAGSGAETAAGVAGYLSLFDDVLAGNGCENLSGEAKLRRLQERFGSDFDYAGNDLSDIGVWKRCRHAIVVNASPRVLRAARKHASVVRVFARGRGAAKDWIRSLRLHQWVKNILIFTPLLASHTATPWPLLRNTILTFIAFCLSASGIYILNDLFDLESDRVHPIKSSRPFARGSLPVTSGFVVALLLILVGIGICAAVSRGCLAALLTYVGLALAYSLRLRQMELLDVFALASLYTIRIFAGQAASGIVVSAWLLSFSMFLFLSLGFCKRTSELRNAWSLKGTQPGGRAYRASDVEQLNLYGVSTGFLSSLVLTLYMQSDSVRILYKRPQVLWMLLPLLLYWIARVWMLAFRGTMNEDPVLFAVTDKITWIVGGCAALLLIAATWPSAF